MRRNPTLAVESVDSIRSDINNGSSYRNQRQLTVPIPDTRQLLLDIVGSTTKRSCVATKSNVVDRTSVEIQLLLKSTESAYSSYTEYSRTVFDRAK